MKEYVPTPENRKEPEPTWSFLPDWEEVERWWRVRRHLNKLRAEERLQNLGMVPLWGTWWSGL